MCYSGHMTYDKTSRKKILNYAEIHGVRPALKKFEISSATYYVWKAQEAPDYVKPPRKPFFRKMDPAELQAYVEANPDLTCAQIGLHFKVSDVSVFHALRKLGFSFKKRSFSIKSVTKKNGQNIKSSSDK